VSELIDLASASLVDDGGQGTRILVLHDDGRIIRGIWEIDPGVVTDVEADELFVVHSGSATVRFLDSGDVWELRPGSVGIFDGGERTEWTVHERLRKAYQITL
jgi:uncharacterized cupin superfamily protein